MSKKCYRFFGGLLTVQKNWLNKMAEKGYRLIRTGKLLYEFEKCKPGQVQYCVEFIGQKSKANAEDYHDFLEEMGYSVFYKNINELRVGDCLGTECIFHRKNAVDKRRASSDAVSICGRFTSKLLKELREIRVRR